MKGWEFRLGDGVEGSHVGLKSLQSLEGGAVKNKSGLPFWSMFFANIIFISSARMRRKRIEMSRVVVD